MRVISGSAKGRKLKPVPGSTTRPIMDRVKENLFNILGDEVIDTRWLDLFAGTGQVGIEALSRGATRVVFVDNVRAAVGTIRSNLSITGLSQQAEVRQADAFDYLKRFNGQPFDLIYIAPPQYHEIWRQALEFVDQNAVRLISPGGLAVAQIDPREYAELPLTKLRLVDLRRYGNTQLCFYQTE